MIVETRDEYVQRMWSECRQFRHFGIQPVWRPGERDIEGFCHDEVVRQSHDPRVRYDGGIRVEQMLRAWEYAQERATTGPSTEASGDMLPSGVWPPTVQDVLMLGKLIEPHMNAGGFRLENVYIGSSVGAPPKLVPVLMEQVCDVVEELEPEWALRGPPPREYRKLWKQREGYRGVEAREDAPKRFRELLDDVVTVVDWYAAYEAVHPFGDGNGRSGKVLSNWLAGTLDDPVLVPDVFGGGNP